MKISLSDEALLRRQIFSFYFLLIAFPLGLIALYGDLIYVSCFCTEIIHWHQQPHSLSFFGGVLLLLFYVVLINAGFLLLPGYARSFRRRDNDSRNSGNQFWLCSLAYNVILGAVNGSFACEAHWGTTLLDPSGLSFWVMCFPAVGAIFSAFCLTMPTNRHA